MLSAAIGIPDPFVYAGSPVLNHVFLGIFSALAVAEAALSSDSPHDVVTTKINLKPLVGVWGDLLWRTPSPAVDLAI